MGFMFGFVFGVLIFCFGFGRLNCRLICVSVLIIGVLFGIKVMFSMFVLIFEKVNVLDMVLVNVFLVLFVVFVKINKCFLVLVL